MLADVPPKVLVAVVAYDCEASVGEVVRQCRAHTRDVLVVDDGSHDATSTEARSAGARVLRHERNLGKGVAIRTAARQALLGGHTGLLTIDGDGQHDGDDLPTFLEAHRNSPSAVHVGWRRDSLARASAARRFGNRFSDRAVELFAGVHLPDTQCGLRLYPSSLLRRLSLRGTRYETETEILLKAHALGFELRPLPVRVRFADGRPTSHFRPWRDSMRICVSVLGHHVRRRLANPPGLIACLAATHAPLAAAAIGAVGWRAAILPALAHHAAMTASLLRPGGQAWVETETDFQPLPGTAEVALTFDDGPDPGTTPRVLAMLHREGVPATFFVIGRRVREFPDLVAEMAARGHALGNHTHRHLAAFSLLTPSALADEIDRAQEAVERVCGRVPVVLRPPAGHKNPFLGSALRRRGLRCVTWTLRSLDTLGWDPLRLAGRLAERVRPGSIVLLHDTVCGRLPMLDLVPRLLDRLRERGFRCVTLPGAA